LIQLNAESASYQGVKTLHDIDLHVKKGEKLALVGQSGSGKSTLIKLIYDRYPVGTALVPQDYGLVHHLSVYHNIYIGCLGQHSTLYNLANLIRPWPDQVETVRTILSGLQLEEQIFRPVGKLSGGQKQRVAVARSLYQKGQLLLADEPVSSVDEQQSKVVLTQLINGFSTIVLAMHDIQLALAFCDRIIGLENGRIVLDSPSKSLTTQDLLSLY
jgi:phosphonate transport system ATP-binding protein